MSFESVAGYRYMHSLRFFFVLGYYHRALFVDVVLGVFYHLPFGVMAYRWPCLLYGNSA